jgi:hypothetical protein
MGIARAGERNVKTALRLAAEVPLTLICLQRWPLRPLLMTAAGIVVR